MRIVALQMKIFVLLIVLVFAGPVLIAQSLDWLNQIGGIADENVNDLKIDKQGNIIIAGTFQYIADFDPGPGEFVLKSKGLADVFIAKYDSLGNFIWANQFGSIYDDYQDVFVEIDSFGTVYLGLSGYYGSTVEFYSTNQTYKINSVASTRSLILQLDLNGTSGRLKYFNSHILDLALDQKNNQFIQFAMDNVTLIIDGVWTNSLAVGAGIFLVKMAKFADIKWARQLGNSVQFSNRIQIDQVGSAYCLSNFKDTYSTSINGKTDTLIAVETTDMLLSKVDSTGELLWVKQLVGVNNVPVLANLALVGNEVVVCGGFIDRIIIDPQKEKKFLLAVNACHNNAFFFCKISQAGSFINISDATQWIATGECITPRKSMILQNKIYIYSRSNIVYVYSTDFSELTRTELKYSHFSTDKFNMQVYNDRLIVSADFQGKFDFDPTCRQVELTSNIQSKDIFMLRLNLTESSKVIDSILGKREICFGDPLELISPLVANSSWSTGQTGKSITILKNQIGINYIWVEGLNKDSCFVRYNIDVFVKPRPTIPAMNITAICEGDSAVLGAKGATTYLWSTGQLDSAIFVKPNSTSAYSITATNADGCSASGDFIVEVNPLPNANAGTDQTICAGKQAILTATGGQTYRWNNNSNLASITVSPATTITYTVTATDSNGCKSADQVGVVVNPLPIADAGPNQTICSGDTVFLEANGGVAYLWNNSSTTKSLIANPLLSTTFVVTVTDANGCTASDNVNIKVNPNPDVDLLGIDTLKLKIGQFVILYAGKGEKFLWSTGDTSNTIVIDQKSSWYCVTVTNTFGCRGSDCLFVQLPPNATSDLDKGSVTIYPNPSNDFNTIDVHNSSTPKYDFRLFNAAGQIVYQLNNITTPAQQIEVAQLPPGQYLAHMVFEGYTVVDKLLIVR